ncbi:aroma-sacti cluster domain-containing protein [Streptacidiphilus albus]|uniref:aroma-sacti cluster domain-containing protein n=1 Tax=Streptacidiphilus albus TaxID=105425 RepID=UPI00054C7292|nr:aroma-sacti cluster domain-containing protein [Streptacidiphilus albus]
MTDDRTARIGRLYEAGFVVDAFSEEQVEVLLGLGPDELNILLDIKSRLDEAAPEVEAHSEIAGGALF